MGIKDLFLHKSMADLEGQTTDNLTSLASGLGALGVLGISGHLAYKRLKGNQAINPSTILGGRRGQVARGVGNILKDTAATTTQDQMKKARELATQIGEADGVKKILAGIQSREALVASLSASLDDPSMFNLPSEQTLAWKQSLLDELSQASSAGTTGDVVTELHETIVRAIYEHNGGGETGGKALSRFKSSLREFSRVGVGLALPDLTTREANKAFNSVSYSDLKGPSTGRADKLLKHFGAEQIQFFTKKVGDRTQTYARVNRAGSTKWLDTLPLDLAYDPSAGHLNQISMGESLQTNYFGSKYTVEADTLKSMIKNKGKGKVGIDDIIANQTKVEDFEINKFINLKNKSPSGFITGRALRDYRAERRQPYGTAPRAMSSGGKYGAHLEQASKFQHNSINIQGFGRASSADQDYMLTGLVGNQKLGLDPNVGADRFATGQFGIFKGSALDIVRAGTPLSRADIPVISRLEQIVGRASSFGFGTSTTMGKGGAMVAGAAGNKPIMWGETLTGVINKAVLLDVGGRKFGERGSKLYQDLAGQGQAYTTGAQDLLVSEFTKPVLDPTAHKNISSTLFEQIRKQEPGVKKRYSRAEIEANKGFLGVGPSGNQYLNIDPRMEYMELGWEQIAEVGDKKQWHIIGTQARMQETSKLFGPEFKGMTSNIGAAEWWASLSDSSFNAEEARRYSMPIKHTLLSTGDNLKKASAFMQRQMITGFGMTSGVGSGYESFVEQRIKGGAGKALGARLGGSNLAAVTGGVLQSIADVGFEAGGMDNKSAGRVLAGVWNRGMRGEGKRSWYGDAGMERSVVEKEMNKLFGEKRTKSIIEIADEGLAIGGGSMSAGTGVGDHKLGRSSVEPRFLEMLQHRLTGMGMSTDDVSSTIADVYKHKIGFADQMKAAVGLTGMTKSLVGAQGMLDADVQNATRLSVADWAKISSETDGSFSEYLKTQKNGVILDLGNTGNTQIGAIISDSASEAFGGSREIRFPGGASMEGIKGTYIRGKEGTEKIGGRYERMVDDFADNLTRITNSEAKAKESAAASFKQFRKDATRMYSDVFTGLARGKIKGSASMVSKQYGVAGGTGLSAKNRELIQGLVEKTQGTAVFVDDKGFLSQLKDFMGSDPDAKFGEAGWKMKTFFTGVEGGVGGATGIAGAVVRNPVLGMGNVNVANVFRDVQQAGKAGVDDDAWKWFMGLEAKEGQKLGAGQKALQKLRADTGAKVSGFGDIARLGDKHSGAVKGFFKSMASNVGEYMGEGGGSLYIANTKLDVHYNNKVHSIDFGIAGQALGDFDGDQWTVMLFGKKTGQNIMSTMKKEEYASYLDMAGKYKTSMHILTGEAKAGLGKHTPSGEVTDLSKVGSQVLAEKASKAEVGVLDTKINTLRRAILDQGAGGEDALAMLTVVQEHAVLKGKKLKEFRPFAKSMGSALDRLFDTGEVDSLHTFLQTEIFKGSDFAAGKEIAYSSQGAVPYTQKAIDGSVGMQNIMNDIQKAANSARSRGLHTGESAGQMGAAFNRPGLTGRQAFANLAMAGETTASGMMNSSMELAERTIGKAGGVFDQILSAGRKIDSKTMGIAAMGILGASAVGGMLGQGYAADPIVMAGEVSNQNIERAMASQQLFSGGESGPSAEEFANAQQQHGMMDTPINSSTTYMNRPNSYQVRGQLSNSGAIGNLARNMGGYMNGGSAHVTINDRRRPLSPSYLDRMLGDY